MADEQPASASAPAESAKSPYVGVRKFIYALLVLFIVWLIPGQIIPRVTSMYDTPLPAPEIPAAVDVMPVPLPPPPPTLQTDPALSDHVARLEAKMKVMEDVMASSPPQSTGDNPPLQEQLNELKAKLDAIGEISSPMFGVDDGRVHALEEKLAAQETHVAALTAKLDAIEQQSTDRISAIIALEQLRTALAEGRSIDVPWTRIKHAVNGNDNAARLVAALEPSLMAGIDTLATLQDDFETALPNALDPNEQSSSFVTNIRSLISIRKIGAQQGTDDESVIARAEIHLARGKVDACLKELSALSPDAANRMNPWMARAERYAQAQTLMNELYLAFTGDPAIAPTGATE